MCLASNNSSRTASLGSISMRVWRRALTLVHRLRWVVSAFLGCLVVVDGQIGNRCENGGFAGAEMIIWLVVRVWRVGRKRDKCFHCLLCFQSSQPFAFSAANPPPQSTFNFTAGSNNLEVSVCRLEVVVNVVFRYFNFRICLHDLVVFRTIYMVDFNVLDA